MLRDYSTALLAVLPIKTRGTIWYWIHAALMVFTVTPSDCLC